MTAIACLNNVILRAETVDEFLTSLPSNATVFPSKEAFFELHYVADYLRQNLDEATLLRIRNEGNARESTWSFLVTSSVSIAEGRQRLAQQGSLKLTRAETPAPQKATQEREDDPARRCGARRRKEVYCP